MPWFQIFAESEQKLSKCQQVKWIICEAMLQPLTLWIEQWFRLSAAGWLLIWLPSKLWTNVRFLETALDGHDIDQAWLGSREHFWQVEIANWNVNRHICRCGKNGLHGLWKRNGLHSNQQILNYHLLRWNPANNKYYESEWWITIWKINQVPPLLQKKNNVSHATKKNEWIKWGFVNDALNIQNNNKAPRFGWLERLDGKWVSWSRFPNP